MIGKLLNHAERAAYDAGQHCGLNGPDTTNCHFSHFATPEQTKAWEQGKANGEMQKKEPA